MHDLFWSLKSVDSFTVYVLLTLVLFVSWFIREIVGSTMLATVSAPILIGGGLLSHQLFQMAMVTVSYDKDSNELITVGVGVLVSLILVILSSFGISKYRDYRAKIAQPLPVPNNPVGRI